MPDSTRIHAAWPPPTTARFQIESSDIKPPPHVPAYTWRGYWVPFVLREHVTYEWVEPPT